MAWHLNLWSGKWPLRSCPGLNSGMKGNAALWEGQMFSPKYTFYIPVNFYGQWSREINLLLEFQQLGAAGCFAPKPWLVPTTSGGTFQAIANKISTTSLTSVCSAVLPLSFPPLEVGSSAWTQQAQNLLCWPCEQGHYVDITLCFKFGLKQGWKITGSGGWSKKTYRAAEHISLHFMRSATFILALEQGKDCAHLLNKVLQLSLAATPCLFHTSTVTFSPSYTFSLLKSRHKCPNS